MAGDKATKQDGDHNEHEAVLTGVVALASLFSNCVEAFGLINPNHKWEKEEQLLLCKLGIQQARLLIWGDVVGVASPPASVTDRAVPKRPSAAYPDLKEPTFFGPRDHRLDEAEMRTKIESALSDIVDRPSHATRVEMMDKYGLRPPKKFASEYHPALDTNRLEAFRERYELLNEVAETYAHINARRASSLAASPWAVAEPTKFASFVKLTQEKIDFLIEMMGVKDRIDRAMCMDIRGLGWHLSADRARIALDVSKLRLISEVSKQEYPEYLNATQQALDNMERERKENVMSYNPYASLQAAPVSTTQEAPAPRRGSVPFAHTPHTTNGNTNGSPAKEKGPGLLGKLFGRKSSTSANAGRSRSVSAASSASQEEDTPRSLSDSGPARASDDSTEPLSPERAKSVGAVMETPDEKIRSKSVGDILTAPTDTEAEGILQAKLERLNTQATESEPMEDGAPITSAISRHDQFQGLGRQGTKENW